MCDQYGITTKANVFIRKNNNGIPIFYSNLRINGKRIRKSLGSNRKAAEIKLTKLEYDLTFQNFKEPESPQILFHHVIIPFLKELESEGIKSEQIYN